MCTSNRKVLLESKQVNMRYRKYVPVYQLNIILMNTTPVFFITLFVQIFVNEMRVSMTASVNN